MSSIRKNSFWILSFLVFLICLIFFISQFFAGAILSDRSWEVIFFDVGQGDSAIIQKGNFQILIDGGPDKTIIEKLGKYVPFYDKTIEIVILSHPQKDHLAGIVHVLDSYEVRNIISGWSWYDSDLYREYLQKASEENSSLYESSSVGRIQFLTKSKIQNSIFQSMALHHTLSIFHNIESIDALTLDFLYPRSSFFGKELRNVNNSSQVFKVHLDDKCILFTGDIEKSVEDNLLETDIDLHCEVLKVAHHGSKTSSSKRFVMRVRPDTAIISVGKNRFGHPDEEVIRSLEEIGIDVRVTLEEGDVIF